LNLVFVIEPEFDKKCLEHWQLKASIQGAFQPMQRESRH